MNITQETWQVEVNGKLYETNIEGLAKWIDEGSLLAEDKIRRGNLRWIEAGKIPHLDTFFNAKKLGIAPPLVSKTFVNQIENDKIHNTNNGVNINNNSQLIIDEASPSETIEQKLPVNKITNNRTKINKNICAVHADVKPRYVCETCANVFCKECPNTYGSVKICPFCGAMCRTIETINEKRKSESNQLKGFGINAFFNALVYPLRFKTSLILGAIMYLFFTLGQSASAIGGVYLLVGSVFCAMLANTLTFGILANTVENIAQGKLALDFMPRFDEFSLWDDVIHPFFLSIGVYLVSFGLLIIVGIGVIWFGWNSVKSSMPETLNSTSGINLKTDSVSGKQITVFNQLSEQLNQNKQLKDGDNNLKNQNTVTQISDENEKNNELEQLRKSVTQSRNEKYKTLVSEKITDEENKYGIIGTILLQANVWILLIMGILLIGGLFYFPVACAVAGYTRSITAVINPAIGLDTIKHLRSDYFKILLAGIFFIIFSTSVNLILSVIFSPLNLPVIGNLPAIAVTSILNFYIWISFSVLIGFLLNKNSTMLNLFQVKNEWSISTKHKQ